MELKIVWANKQQTSGKDEVAIVVDILRATSTITACIGFGAKFVVPTMKVEEAFQLSKEHDALLIGERNSIKVEGFHLGNSPASVNRQNVQGKKIIFTSTNFPKTLNVSKNSPFVLVGSMLNLRHVSMVAYQIALDRKINISYVLAGGSEFSSTEDLVFAGVSSRVLNGTDVSKEIRDAKNLISGRDPEELIKNSLHGKGLREKGYGQDVEFSCQQDIFDVVPIVKDNKIIKFK